MIYVNINYENRNIDIRSDRILFGEKAKIYNNFCNEVKKRFLGLSLNQQTLSCLRDLVNKTNEKLKIAKEDLEIVFLMD